MARLGHARRGQQGGHDHGPHAAGLRIPGQHQYRAITAGRGSEPRSHLAASAQSDQSSAGPQSATSAKELAFGVGSLLVYGAAIALGVAVRRDRKALSWAAAGLTGVQLVFAGLVYYDSIYVARPMDMGDWIEGTAFVALIGAASCLSELRLAGVALTSVRRAEVSPVEALTR